MTAVEAGKPAGPGAESAVRVLGADRRFGDVLVLDNIDLEVATGAIFGLVGPSGCGKTTLVRLIVGLLKPSQGTVLVNGVEPVRFGTREKREIGYVPQDFSLYPTLTVWENARFMASLYGLGWLVRRDRIREVLTFLEIWDARNRLAQDLSGGMKRRLSLAGALLHEPSIMVVDEPTAGLDPALRVRIWEQLREVRDRGTTIFITTQYIEEAERCDRVAVMSAGRLVAAASPGELRERAGVPDVLELAATNVSLPVIDEIWNVPGVLGVDWDRAERLTLRVTNASTVLLHIEAVLQAHGCVVASIQQRQASFEEVFMHYTEPA